ncbi:hypothetical protein ACQKGI_12650 [Peribacillus muralis]|uniref:hypothetical protein n=1 Tax=Peribacillus muralis TaxID=264697 RepID=UPI003D077087
MKMIGISQSKQDAKKLQRPSGSGALILHLKKLGGRMNHDQARIIRVPGRINEWEGRIVPVPGRIKAI